MDKNPTKKCPECLAEVPTEARKCSHCGSQFKQPTSRVVKLFTVLIGLGFVTSMIAVMTSPSSTYSVPDEPSTYDYKLSAESFSQLYIQQLLKSPSTADFCRGTVTSLGENKWKVSSCVDSQNSFGAMIRANWETTALFTGGDVEDIGAWKIEKITFDGKVIK